MSPDRSDIFHADTVTKLRHAARAGRLAFVMSSRPRQFSKGFQQIERLLRNSEEFQRSIAESAEIVQKKLGWSLYDTIAAAKDDALPGGEERVEPLMTAIQIALCDVLFSINVVPSAVLCLSGGEFAAAYATRAIEASSAMELVCAWSQALAEGVGTGAAILIRLDAGEAMAIASRSPGPVFLACDFSPGVVLLATTHENTEPLIALFHEHGTPVQRMPYRAGYHSELMSDWRARAESTVARIGIGAPRIPLYSSTVGDRAATLDASHWGKVIAGCAYFHHATRAMLQNGFTVLLEVNAVENISAPIRMTASTYHHEIEVIPLIASQPESPRISTQAI